MCGRPLESDAKERTCPCIDLLQAWTEITLIGSLPCTTALVADKDLRISMATEAHSSHASSAWTDRHGIMEHVAHTTLTRSTGMESYIDSNITSKFSSDHYHLDSAQEANRALVWAGQA